MRGAGQGGLLFWGLYEDLDKKTSKNRLERFWNLTCSIFVSDFARIQATEVWRHRLRHFRNVLSGGCSFRLSDGNRD
ncbi:hypothetical protein RSSM_03787 [Rhodopirellula sallentina SM41]|uniref:Uncharacterized protein n=1 Tax=Rhodopirellula sallentina SM41 TaxID=1263870 RepID=M5UFK7_9BACT|nr:hypothetical protein RSSM_03787 [Rhodopirellula sallentina SM41]